MDQATSLREMYIENEVSVPQSHTNEGKVILVTSGKGGVGKSLLTVNLAASIGTA
ncbi:MAG: P-loop NTPase, partial [Candidatus Marinimicrobia bacterium]|nr:P-loop NTPase [Candidatus Neomarinimicrobiota bacterium]